MQDYIITFSDIANIVSSNGSTIGTVIFDFICGAIIIIGISSITDQKSASGLLSLWFMIIAIACFYSCAKNSDDELINKPEYIEIAYDKYEDYCNYIVGVEEVYPNNPTGNSDVRILIKLPDLDVEYFIYLKYKDGSKYKGIKTVENSDRDYYVLKKDTEGLTLIHYKAFDKSAEPTYSSEFGLVTTKK